MDENGVEFSIEILNILIKREQKIEKKLRIRMDENKVII